MLLEYVHSALKQALQILVTNPTPNTLILQGPKITALFFSAIIYLTYFSKYSSF